MPYPNPPREHRRVNRVFWIAGLVMTILLFSTLRYLESALGDDPFSPDVSSTNTGSNPEMNVITNAEFVDTPVTTIFRMISDMTGWSIVMSPEVSKQPPKINIWIKNMSPSDVLEQVGVMGELAMERQGDTIRVMTFDEYTRTYGVEKRKIQIKHASAKSIAAALKPFAAKDDQARILADEQSNSIVLLVPRPLIDSLVRLAEGLDVPYESDKIEIVKLKHLQAAMIVPELEEFLTQSQKARSAQSPKVQPGEGSETMAGGGYLLKFMVEPRLNVIILRGASNDVTRAIDLISQLDVPHSIRIVAYELKYTNAEDVFGTIQDIMEEDLQGSATRQSRLKLSMTKQTNRIVAEGSAEDHEKLAQLLAAVDVPLPPGNRATRVYRLTNATSEEVAKVITELIADSAENKVARVASGRRGQNDLPPSQVEAGSNPAQSEASYDVVATQAPMLSMPARVTAVPEINAVVIRASASEHEEFAHLIHEMDRPRDQVILEVTVVTVRANDDFELGVELGGAILGQRTQSIGLTTFGIGRPDTVEQANGQELVTGRVEVGVPTPLGLNFAIFNADDFSLVLNALKTVGEVRVTSAPKLLVQDNAAAMISQLNQEPYESTSQGESSTLTSFGGFVDAGTALMVTPHISQENWLRLDYQLQMSTFGSRTAEQAAANLPPPKRQTEAAGTVRVPAEHTVVLGGLTGDREDNTVDSVPFLSDIPGLGELFKNRFYGKIKETTYIFIRPVLLRDPSFRDLLYLSERDIADAKLRQNEYPVNPLKTFAPTEEDHDETN